MPTKPQNGFDPVAQTAARAAVRLPAYILAGGHSRRFGRDKARAQIDGAAMIVQVASVLARVSQSITVVAAHAGEYDDLGLTTIGDVVAEKGPAGGVLSAIEHDSRGNGTGAGGWLLVSACDWVGVRPEWVGELVRARHDTAHAVVFRSGPLDRSDRSERLEPLFGLYHHSAGGRIAACVEAGELQLQTILRELITVVVPSPGDWDRAVNVNHPSDRPSDPP